MRFTFLLLVSISVLIAARPAQDSEKTIPATGMLAAQLWTFRYELQKDVPGTLKKIKKLGIDYVEGFDAPYITGNAQQFRSQLDAAGLKMFALHWNELDDWRKNPTAIFKIAKKLGAQYTGIAWLKMTKADTVTYDIVNEAADILTKVCPQAKQAGIQLYYHIHGYELQPMAGDKTFFDSFVSRIDYSCVRLEADIFWITYAGWNAAQFME